MQSTGERQQFTWTNKVVDGLISNIENFKALSLMEFKGKQFDEDRQP